MVEGWCDSGFSRVADQFRANFTERGEIGAAVCVIVGDRVVADLWGGLADPAARRPWRRGTIVNVFSAAKPFVALCALRLVERGALDLDDPLARVWPEFAPHKSGVTLRHVLSHRAGLPAIREPLPDGAMLDWTTMTEALARQAPWWEPGTAHGYHVNTFGHLVGEAVRRVTGESVGRMLRTQVAGPLDADVHVGLASDDAHDVATFVWPPSATPEDALTPDLSALSEEHLMRWNAYFNPRGLSGAGWVNTRAWRAAEIPSTNAHGNARGLARAYAALAPTGGLLASPMLAAATTEHSSGLDLVARRPSRFGLGFQLTQPERPLGPNDGAFGHFGAGGALGFRDPEADVAFGYVMNELGPRWQNPRNRALVDAVYASL